MILITGATGNNGRALLERLSAKGVKSRALVRNTEKAGALEKLPNVEIAYGDLGKPDTLRPALEGVTKAMLISSSSPEMRDVQCAFTDAAKAAGVRHIVKLSGIMPDVDSPFRFARMHGEIEKHIERSGLEWTQLRAGEFMVSYFRQAAAISGKGVLPLPMGEGRIACIDVADLADASAAVLTTEGHAGKIYPLTGPEALTMAEVAQALSRVTGKTIRYVDISPAEARAARLAAGMPEYQADALDELFAERRRGKEGTVFDTLQTVFRITPTRFETFATRHAAIFRGTP